MNIFWQYFEFLRKNIFLGSYDATVFVWDIGGRKGTVYELHGHRQKVTFIRFLPSANQLMSAGEDGNLVLWDMATKRAEVTIC